MKEAVIAEHLEINMVVVTGNVVSDQPGQLDAQDYADTVIAVYAMI